MEDFPRARAIFELAVAQPSLSMPELLWKAYIDFEIEEGDREKARSLYERLINLSGHHKVWISYAEFEGSSIPIPRALREDEEDEEDDDAAAKVVEGDLDLARQVFERGYKDLKSKGLKGEVSTITTSIHCRILRHVRQRVALLEAWKKFEQNHGDESGVAKVQGMMPIVGRKQHVDQETGQVVEGSPASSSYSPIVSHVVILQIGNLSLRTMNAKPTPQHSSSYKWRMLGLSSALAGLVGSPASHQHRNLALHLVLEPPPMMWKWIKMMMMEVTLPVRRVDVYRTLS